MVGMSYLCFQCETEIYQWGGMESQVGWSGFALTGNFWYFTAYDQNILGGKISNQSVILFDQLKKKNLNKCTTELERERVCVACVPMFDCMNARVCVCVLDREGSGLVEDLWQ